MPFVSQPHRDEGHITCSVGDICYKYYLPLIKKWNANRRWTTWHNMFKQRFNLTDEQAAEYSAWAVFFCHEVMKYEEEKCKENGNIE